MDSFECNSTAVADLEGRNIRIVLSRGENTNARLHHIFALTVFEGIDHICFFIVIAFFSDPQSLGTDSIFWTDWETKSVEKCNKYNGGDRETIITTIHRPMDIQVMIFACVISFCLSILCCIHLLCFNLRFIIH